MNFIDNSHLDSGGIYKISNLMNGRFYYGSTRRFRTRWVEHQAALCRGKHTNVFLQRDFNKCGTGAFVIEVIEVIEGERDVRLAAEEVWLRQYYDGGKVCYNLSPRAVSREGSPDRHQRQRKPASEETKAKMSLASKGKLKGPFSDAVRARNLDRWVRFGESRRGSKNPCSDETREKISRAQRGKPRPNPLASVGNENRAKIYPVVLLDPQGRKHGPIRNAAKFCREYKLPYSKFPGFLHGVSTYYHGWRKITDTE